MLELIALWESDWWGGLPPDHRWVVGIGIAAFAIQFLSYQGRTGTRILAYLSIAGILWVVHFGLLGHWVSGVVLGVSVVRNVIAVLGARLIWVGLVGSLAVVPIVVEALTVGGSLISFLAMMGGLCGTVGAVLHRQTTLARAGLAMSSVVWLVHHAMIGSWPGVLNTLTMIGSNAIGWWRHRQHRELVANSVGR